jgi:hypothetical protein
VEVARVTGLLEQLAGGGLGRRLALVDEPAWQLEQRLARPGPVLADEHDILRIRESQHDGRVLLHDHLELALDAVRGAEPAADDRAPARVQRPFPEQLPVLAHPASAASISSKKPSSSRT